MNQAPLPGMPASTSSRADVVVRFSSEGHPDYQVTVREALVVGSFAVHRTVHGNPYMRCIGATAEGLTVTHVLTGLAIAVSIPDERRALELAHYLEQLPIDWSSADEAAIRNSVGPLLRTEIRAHVGMSGGRS